MDVFRQSVKGAKKKRNRLILAKFEEDESALCGEVRKVEKELETVEI